MKNHNEIAEIIIGALIVVAMFLMAYVVLLITHD
jgi:hypothetical protein